MKPISVATLLCVLIATTLGAFGQPVHNSDASTSGVIDLSLNLLYLPSIMSSTGLEHLAVATQSFLETKFDLYSILLCDLKVATGSQALDGRQYVGDNTTSYVVNVDLQILVCFESQYELWDMKDMETVLRFHFTEDEDDLRAALQIIDESFFQAVKYIELESKEDQNGSEDEDEWLHFNGVSFKLIVIYMVIGVAIVNFSIILLIPLCNSRQNGKQPSLSETDDSSCTTTGTPADPEELVISQIRIPNTYPAEPLYILPDRCTKATSNTPKMEKEKSPTVSSNVSDSCPSLYTLRAQKMGAESKVKKQLSEIMKKTEHGGGSSRNQERPERQRSSGHALSRTRESKVVGRTREDLASRNEGEASPKRRVHGRKAKNAGSNGGTSVKDTGVQQTTDTPERQFTVQGVTAPVQYISHLDGHDGCSVSTITGGASAFPSSISRHFGTTRSSVFSHGIMGETSLDVSESDDFGSIANSVPPGMTMPKGQKG
eukprot:Nitzschia sp. Nitz4//scaffold21_size171442//35572//37121//NITZ4_002149-RA/size171442-augustus-gene-0.200-mRNA-1//-1//CDS//3329542375//871//frame0